MPTTTPPLTRPVLIAWNVIDDVESLLVLDLNLAGVERVLARLARSSNSKGAVDAGKVFARARAYELPCYPDNPDPVLTPSPALAELMAVSDCYGMPTAKLPAEILAELETGPQMGTVRCKAEDGRIIFGLYIPHVGPYRLAAVYRETWLKLRCRMVKPAGRPEAFRQLLQAYPAEAARWLLDGCRIGMEPEGSLLLCPEDVARTPVDLACLLASPNAELRLQALALVGRTSSTEAGKQKPARRRGR